jgi:hypothetical protein
VEAVSSSESSGGAVELRSFPTEGGTGPEEEHKEGSKSTTTKSSSSKVAVVVP